MKLLTARPKKIALVGLANTTRDLANLSDADEIWSLNWWYKGDFLNRIDRMFEMHPIWALADSTKEEYQKPREHWKWLQQPHDFPIYMLENRPEVPACIRYPIEDVTKYLFGNNLVKGDYAVQVYGSSLDYMMALAIYMKPKVIELFGIEMGSSTEYRYQRESMALMVGIAISKGITVKIPNESIMLKTKLYGYQGGQMIFRQDLERLHTQARKRADTEMARLQFLEGRKANQLQMTLQYKDEESLAKLNEEYDAQVKATIYAQAFRDSLEYLIREVDGEETNLSAKSPVSLRKVTV